MTFRQWDERARRLANALVGLGLDKGDRVAILAHNSVEWMEIYAATANAGLVMVPINFRLVGAEIRYIVEDSEAKALIVRHDPVGAVEAIRGDLSIAESRYLHFGSAAAPKRYRALEERS
jgi:fatty-acyl-CoA synthase